MLLKGVHPFQGAKKKKKRFVSYRHDLRPVGWRTTRLPCVFGYFRSNSTSDSWRTEVCYFRPVSTDSISYLHKSRSILTSVCLGYFTMCFFQSRPQYFMTLYHLLQNKQEKSELKSNLQRKQWCERSCDFLLQYMHSPFLIYFTVLGNAMLKSLIIKQISLTPFTFAVGGQKTLQETRGEWWDLAWNRNGVNTLSWEEN